jgi:outer membrane usher protein
VKTSKTGNRFVNRCCLTGCHILTVLSFVFFSSIVSYAAETVILTVSLNTISHGEFFLKRNKDGSLLMRSEDLRQIGLKIATIPVTTVDSVAYVSLNNLSGVTAVLDEKKQLLDLRAGPTRVDLPHVIQNFSPGSGTYVPTSETSAFINYRLDYGNGIDVQASTWSATGQSGLHRGNLLLLGDGYYQGNQKTQHAVRLMTNLSWDRPESMSRWVAGDINASAGDPSGPILMGGLGYSSTYSMNPGLITYPMGEFGGVTTLPSEADIYVNGVLVRRERLAPGDYRFKNLPVSNGANNIEILLRDSFGNERWSTTRFYLSEQLLKTGLHDYSYNMGFMRLDFGSASNSYGRPLLVARHMLGVNNSLTMGAGAEAGNNLVNLNPRAVISLGRVGVLNLLAGESSDRERGWGTTMGIGYQFQSLHVNYHLNLSHNTRGYRTLANQQANDTARLDGGTGISLGSSFLGTVSLNGSYIETYAGQLIRSIGVSYSRALSKSVQFTASWNTSWGTTNSVNFFTGLTFFPTRDLTASATLQTSQGNNKETLSLQKSLPVGEGIGYRATLEREQNQTQTLLRANPYLQVNGSHGSYTADLQGQFNQQDGKTTGSYLVSAAGALVYAGGHLGLSRPVSSSFAVVQVEGLPDVTILLNNQEVARTNANGMAYITNLQSYQDNKIAFKDNQIEANYLIQRYTANATPGLFGGECIYFPVARIQAYGGHLLAKDGSPLEYAKVTLRGSGHELSFTTLSGGVFYFENLTEDSHETGLRPAGCGDKSPYRLAVVPGMYAVTVSIDGSERHFNMLIPDSKAMYVPLGEFRLPDAPVLK